MLVHASPNRSLRGLQPLGRWHASVTKVQSSHPAEWGWKSQPPLLLPGPERLHTGPVLPLGQPGCAQRERSICGSTMICLAALDKIKGYLGWTDFPS